MRKRLFYWSASALLIISVVLVVWLGSIRLPDLLKPANPGQTFILWAVSTLIFILMVTVGWILVREFIKLYVARQAKRVGSRIRTKLVVGAMLLSSVPVFFLVLWSYEVLNYSLAAWFTNPVDKQVELYKGAAKSLDLEIQNRLSVQAALLAAQPETTRLLASGRMSRRRAPDSSLCRQGLDSVAVLAINGAVLDQYGPFPLQAEDGKRAVAHLDLGNGAVEVAAPIPLNAARQLQQIKQASDAWAEIVGNRKSFRSLYLLLMALITMFVLFIAVWLARILANRISVPLTALLEAAGEVRQGNLQYRVTVPAEDELALLVTGFNQMTEALESSGIELDRRRRFTEAILESIPTGVISVASDGSIQLVNPALTKIFPPEQAARATRLEDLFSREDTAEIKYLMKRARRTGVASRQFELLRTDRPQAAFIRDWSPRSKSKLTSGFVVVLEDTSDLLRAQKAAAWHEVARRVAHEIKNPLTPIALSAERIGRQLDKLDLPPGTARIVRECAATITKSVESVKTLVDEFSQYARFPSAQPVRSDLNEVVSEALQRFPGTASKSISIRTSRFAPNLPPVNSGSRAVGQRVVVVNLVDNGAEAMQDSLVKTLYIATQTGAAAETVELIVADSGVGCQQ